jgi:putative inorganic carbon (hco3(-)) transporter
MDIDSRTASSTGTIYFLSIIYIFLDYLRPQDVISIIGLLRPSLVTIVLLVLFLIKSGKVWSAGSKQTTLMLLFLLLLIIYIPFARNGRAALNTAFMIFGYMPFILAIIISVDTLNRLKMLMHILILIMIYQAIYAILHGGMGSGNCFSDENDLCLYINIWLPFCYFLMLDEKRMKRKLLYGLGLVVGLLAIVVSSSRGGFVGLICMGFVAWLFSNRKVLSIVLIVIFAGIVYFAGGQKYMTEMGTINNKEDSTRVERLLSWEAAWNMFLDKPWGVGGNNFQVWFSEYQPAEIKRGMWGRVAHSLWFTLIPETGVAGVILYLMLLLYNIKDIIFLLRIKKGVNHDRAYLKALGAAYIASFVGFFASASFLSALYYPHYWYACAMIIASKRLAVDNTEQT